MIGLFNQINTIPIRPADVQACHRLGDKSVIVKFVNRKNTDDCLLNRSKLKRHNEYGFDAPVFISEHLTPFNS